MTSLSWYDYQPDQSTLVPGSRQIPDHVQYLRIGFQQLLLLEDRRDDQPPLAFIEVHDRAFRCHPNLKQVQIYLPVVSRIGSHCLGWCDELEQVEFLMKTNHRTTEEGEEDSTPQSQLASLGEASFANCIKLRNVIGLENAAESLRDIGNAAFLRSPLANVNFLPCLRRLRTLGNGTLLENEALVTVDLSKAVHLTELLGATFCRCTALTHIVLPPNLISIGQATFTFCIALEAINYPTTLQTIQACAFFNCRALKTIHFPASLQTVEVNAFGNCKALKAILFEGALSSIEFENRGISLFQNSPSLSRIDLHRNDISQKELWPRTIYKFLSEDDGMLSKWGLGLKNRRSCVFNFLHDKAPEMFDEVSVQQVLAGRCVRTQKAAERAIVDSLNNYKSKAEKRKALDALYRKALADIDCDDNEQEGEEE